MCCRAIPKSRGCFDARISLQEAVWSRFTFRDREPLTEQSARFVTAHRERYAVRIEEAPARRSFPRHGRLDLQRPLQGTVIFIRVTDAAGQAAVLGHTFAVSDLWRHRLVRAEVDLTKHEIRFYALRRKEPDKHVLLSTHDYEPPKKRFSE